MWLNFRRLAALFSCLLCAVLLTQPATGAEKKNFKVAWSIYVGWMPWDYANQSGILKKWADKYGITIQLTQINDYIESINQYTAGSFDACVMTNMDALTVPGRGRGGLDGPDRWRFLQRQRRYRPEGQRQDAGDIKGQPVNLVQLSVSTNLLARALASVSLRERDVKVINTSDADIVGAFTSSAATSVVTWKRNWLPSWRWPTRLKSSTPAGFPGRSST